jgi:hypothetical protein
MPRFEVECDETETLIPLSMLIERLEKHRDKLQLMKNSLRWYEFRARIHISGGIRAYEQEIKCALEFGGMNAIDMIRSRRRA